MKEQDVFTHLGKQTKAVLLDYLNAAFAEMDDDERQAVFGDTVRPPKKKSVAADRLLQEVEEFRSDSLDGKYYAPFSVNSKNFMHIPKETEQWCQRFAHLIADACKLTDKGKHAEAVACFGVLYAVLEAMESGDREIIFAEEAGCWLIPTDEKAWLKAYLTSVAAVSTPEAFTAVAVPILVRDSGHSFASRVFASARAAANPQQWARLQAEVNRKQIRTTSRSQSEA